MTDLGVVMPVYIQKPEFLHAALASLLNQTWDDFRLIIVIDGAPAMEPLVRAQTDGDPRVEIVAYPDNRGVAKALNIGFDVLFADDSVKYLTWVSSDNMYRPSFLATLRQKLAEGPEEQGIVYSSFQSIDNEGRPLYSEAQLAQQRMYQSGPKDMLLDSSIIGVSFMYKACYAKLIGGYSLEPVEDYDYWLRLTEHCDICFVPMELMDYRVNSTYSISAALQSAEKHRKWRYAYHLARHQARIRRNIAPEVTLLFTVREATPAAGLRIENAYEQSYSNYNCFVLDVSPDGQAASKLSGISHPTTEFVQLPGHNEVSSLVHYVPKVETPYVMVLGPEPFRDPSDLQVLVNSMRMTRSEVHSSYMMESAVQKVGYRYAGTIVPKPDIYNELFRTGDLLLLLRLSTS